MLVVMIIRFGCLCFISVWLIGVLWCILMLVSCIFCCRLVEVLLNFVWCGSSCVRLIWLLSWVLVL